jgi:hypothetical protein
MDRTSSTSQRFHFHIHWSRKESLDWEGFDTHAEALVRALEIALPGEMFMIKEISATCPVCGSLSTPGGWGRRLKPHRLLRPT